MTTPGPTTGPGGDPDTVEALQAALAVEHAAVWSLQLVTAFVDRDARATVAAGLAAHRTRRDAVERMLADAGAQPVTARPAYATPQPVTGQASAIALVVTVETDAAAGWRAVVERTDDPDVRTFALESLVDAAVRTARLRGAATAFPGTPA